MGRPSRGDRRLYALDGVGTLLSRGDCDQVGEALDRVRAADLKLILRFAYNLGPYPNSEPDAPLDPRRIKAIVDAAAPMLRGIDWSQRTDEWVGSRPCTTDGLPLIGATRSDRVFVNGGHGMWGIALGPLSGRLLAEQIVGEPTDPLLRSFDPLR